MLKRLIAKITGRVDVEKLIAFSGYYIDFRETYWGHNVMFFSPLEDNKVSCITISTPKPSIGDHLLIPMKSGKTGLCLVLETEYSGDPTDMANVVYGIVGYLEDLDSYPGVDRREGRMFV